MRSMNSVETTKLTASTTIAYGAVIAVMRRPESGGPPTVAAAAGRGGGRLQLRVALDEVVAFDERREVRLVGDVEEDGQDPEEEREDEELVDLEPAAGP